MCNKTRWKMISTTTTLCLLFCCCLFTFVKSEEEDLVSIIDEIERSVMFTHPSQKLSFVHQIPTNISNVYRGNWNGFLKSTSVIKSTLFNKLSSTQQGHEATTTTNEYTGNGEISMKLKSTETILKEYMFVYGDVHLRHGVYIHNRFNHLILEGVYNVFTHVLYCYMKPPQLLNAQLKGTKALFNDTGARLAYQLATNHKSEAKKNLDKEAASMKESADNNCIFKGYFNVRKKANMREQEEQYRSFNSLPEHEKIRRSIFLSVEGEFVGLNCNGTIKVSESTFSVEKFYEKAVRYSVLANAAIFVQILALIYQMNYTNTQSSAARVSMYVVALQAMIDSYVTLLHLTVGIFMDSVFDAFTVTTFLSFALFSVFEMRYLLAVWKANRPEEFQNGWADMRKELQKLYFRFYAFVFIGMIAIYHFPEIFKYFILALHSIWVPQIVLNVVRNSKQSTHPIYVIVTSMARMVIPFYFFMCPTNFIGVEVNGKLCMLLTMWLTLQSFVLVMQHYHGPRWFIPEWVEPKKYNYYREIPQDLLGEEEYNCVICMHPITVIETTALEMEDNHLDSTFESEERPVVTPCSHIFHKSCLQRWMSYSTLCPTCRTPLADGL